tara:strand:+ start:1879 stop:2340 length:462 start_codon:yes stop_codon:yes gene_type:complete
MDILQKFSITATIKSQEESLFHDIDYPTMNERNNIEYANPLYLDKIKSRNFEVEWVYFGDKYNQVLLVEDGLTSIIIKKNGKPFEAYKFQPLAIKVNWFWFINKHNNTNKVNSVIGNGVWDIDVEVKNVMPTMDFRQREIWDKIREDVIGLKT